MKKVVSKSTSKMKRRVNTFKCDLCARKFGTQLGLNIHQRSQHIHQLRTRAKQYANPNKKSYVKDMIAKKIPAMKSTQTTRRTSNVPDITNTVTKAENNIPATESLSTKVEFECPRCFLSFKTHLNASQHIQMFHYGDKKVPSHIQPVCKELCLKCNKKVKSIPPHICGKEDSKQVVGVVYCCNGCSIRFSNKRLFYLHVVSNHSDGVESLFFPTTEEFVMWKVDMEAQTNAKYSEFDNFESKRYYAHCLHKYTGTDRINSESAMENVCPSLIVLQDFPKGLQVHYYSKHYQHSCNNYTFSGKYKKFSITSFLKTSNSYQHLKDLKCDDNDLYVQFRQLMESIVVDAAKLKKDTLTLLFGKALEMMSVLTAYENDDDTSDDDVKPVNRSMTAADIEKALEEPSTLNAISNSDPYQKKVNQEPAGPPPVILNSFSLADSVKSDKQEKGTTEQVNKSSVKVKDVTELKEPNTLSEGRTVKEKAMVKTKNQDSTPSSFNESYTEFLEKNFQVDEIPVQRKSNRRSVMKTRIGQYKPPSPRKTSDPPKDTVPPVPSAPSAQNTNIQSFKLAVSLQPVPALKGNPVVSTADTRKRTCSDVTSVIQKVKALGNVSIEVNKRKESPAQSQAVTAPSQQDRPILMTSNTKVMKPIPEPKVDIKYEVMEQEDDCNILILKI